MPVGLPWRCRLRQRWTWWRRQRIANSALGLGVDAPLACAHAGRAAKPPDHRVVPRFGISLRCGPAAMRERPHPGTEDGVNVAHVPDLRQVMPPALVDAPLMPLIWPLRGETFSMRLKTAPMRGGAPRDAKCPKSLALRCFERICCRLATRNNSEQRTAPSRPESRLIATSPWPLPNEPCLIARVAARRDDGSEIRILPGPPCTSS
jgi:hypothetical protein